MTYSKKSNDKKQMQDRPKRKENPTETYTDADIPSRLTTTYSYIRSSSSTSGEKIRSERPKGLHKHVTKR